MATKMFSTSGTLGGNITNVAGDFTSYGLDAEHLGQYHTQSQGYTTSTEARCSFETGIGQTLLRGRGVMEPEAYMPSRHAQDHTLPDPLLGARAQ